MRRLSLLSVIALICLSSWSPDIITAQTGPSPACTTLNHSSLDGSYYFGNYDNLVFYAWDTITITGAEPSNPWSGQPLLSISLQIAGAEVDSADFPGTLTYVIPANTTATIWWGPNTGSNLTWTVNCEAGSPPPDPDPEPPATLPAPPASQAAPGCDLGMPITASSVVGRFVATTPAYWSPGKLTNPPITLTEGQTAWVLGRDSSHAYYKIVWSCSLLWVPVESMGPNFDHIWRGCPLPTEIVH